MKRLILLVGAFFLCAQGLFAEHYARESAFWEAANSLVGQAKLTLKAGTPIEISPLKATACEAADVEMFTRLITKALLREGFTVVLALDSDTWEKIQENEMYTEDFAEFVAPEALAKKRAYQRPDILLEGALELYREESRGVLTVKANLRAVEAASGSHVWGGDSQGSATFSQYRQEKIDFSLLSAAVVKQTFLQAHEDLKAQAPLAESPIQVYVEPLEEEASLQGLAIEMLQGIPGLQVVSDRKIANAVFYGYVRRLSREAAPTLSTSTKDAQDVCFELQCFLKRVTGEYLWVKSFETHETEWTDKPLTFWERFWGGIGDFLSRHLRVILWIGGGLLGAFLLLMGVAMVRSARTIR